ncbi:hypothetical protein BH09VER1_BH09VER1_49790 [soil metagenome]
MKPDAHSRDSSLLLPALAEALSLPFAGEDFAATLQSALGLVGHAAGAHRVTIYCHSESRVPGEVAGRFCAWTAPGILTSAGLPAISPLAYPALFEKLEAGLAYQSQEPTFSEADCLFVGSDGALSFLCVPIRKGRDSWSFLCAEDCRSSRVWSRAECQAFMVAAAGLGGAIARRASEQFLKEQAAELKRHRNVALSLIEDARHAEQEAARASEAKSKFLAMMSHEIRTPLNGVIGFTDLLVAEGLADRQSEMAEAIRTCGQTLLTLISDILDISKIESDHLLLDPSDGDVFACVRAILSTFEPAAAKAGLTLSFLPEEAAHRWWRLDYARFRQVLFNLIGNAMKFTSHGGISVRLWVTSADDVSRLHCSIADTGRGVSAADLKMIFEPFLQGQGAREVVAGGSGLGLAICRKLIEAMGGEITGTSTIGEGSTFTFDIQAEKVAPSQAQPAPREIPIAIRAGEPAQALRVLVVDDLEMNLRVATSLLQRLGYSAEIAQGGENALQKTERESFDVIFMDVLMPGIDGLETTRRVRAQSGEAGAPRPWIVALTADAMEENHRRCLAAGMDDFLTKPLRLKDMEGCFQRRAAYLAGK